jgi:hypothetical protein
MTSAPRYVYRGRYSQVQPDVRGDVTSQLKIADRTPSADSTLAQYSRWSIVRFGRLLCYEQHDAMCSVNNCVCFKTRYNTITLNIRYAHKLQFPSHHPPPSPQPQFDPSSAARECFLNMRVSLQAKSSPPQPPAATPPLQPCKIHTLPPFSLYILSTDWSKPHSQEGLRSENCTG